MRGPAASRVGSVSVFLRKHIGESGASTASIGLGACSAIAIFSMHI